MGIDMAGRQNKKKGALKARRARDRVRDLPDEVPTGLPAKENVREVVDFVSPENVRYKILKTTERNAYDPVPQTAKKKRTKKRA